MKRVHKVLQLRHHKHTAKLLPHKHTSYGALFLLMCVPIIMIALVGRLVFASDYEVTATVPAPIPAGAPTITTPTNGAVIHDDTVTVSGTCPVISPAVVIAIYDGSTLLGSTMCSATGLYTVSVSLSYGQHELVATVVTITGDTGQSSAGVKVTRTSPNSPSYLGSSNSAGGAGVDYAPDSLLTPLYIAPNKPLLTLNGNRQVVWKGVITGGQLPYRLTIEWGDGKSDSYEVRNHDEQLFIHTYDKINTYSVRIMAVDAQQQKTVLYSVAVTFSLEHRLLLDTANESTPPFIVFIQRYVVQIYIITLSALVFLWYLEHGRHLARRAVPIGANKRYQRSVRRRR